MPDTYESRGYPRPVEIVAWLFMAIALILVLRLQLLTALL